MSKILNRNLNRARLEKPDEYYTQLVDIESNSNIMIIISK